MDDSYFIPNFFSVLFKISKICQNFFDSFSLPLSFESWSDVQNLISTVQTQASSHLFITNICKILFIIVKLNS